MCYGVDLEALTGIELWLDLCVRLLVASVKQDVCRQQWQLGCASVQSETTQRLNADELWTRQAWGLWGVCLSPALRGRQYIHYYRFWQLLNRVGRLPIMGCRSWRWQPFRTTPPCAAWGECGQCGVQSHFNYSISAISAGKWLAQHVCVAGPWHRCSGRMSEALMPSHAQRVCIAGLVTPMRWAITRGIARTTGISALGECPRHWYQCQGQARPALTFIPPPEKALSLRALQSSLLIYIKYI